MVDTGDNRWLVMEAEPFVGNDDDCSTGCQNLERKFDFEMGTRTRRKSCLRYMWNGNLHLLPLVFEEMS